MALSADQRERYARHLLLAEIGDAQQEALCAARVVFAPHVDPGVLAVARAYLERAGAREVREGGEAAVEELIVGPSRADVQRLAGTPALEPAAAALLGAFEAVEAIKQHAGVGAPGTFPDDLTLSEEMP